MRVSVDLGRARVQIFVREARSKSDTVSAPERSAPTSGMSGPSDRNAPLTVKSFDGR